MVKDNEELPDGGTSQPDPVKTAQAIINTASRGRPSTTRRRRGGGSDAESTEQVLRLIAKAKAAAQLAAAIARLPDEQAVVLHHIFVEGLSLPFISRLLGVDVGHLQATKRDALARLAEEMSPAGTGD